jgi:DNA excision repair protein ERCC-2
MADLSYFPYEPRENQGEFIAFLQHAVKQGNACLNAPTGYGKTPCILAALLPIARRLGLKVIWAVRTGNETDRPIEELKTINEVLGRRVMGISFRGKRDMCLLAREIKGELGYDEVAYLCKARGRKCRYRANLSRKLVRGFGDGALLYSEVLRLCAEEEVCPYEAQRTMLPYAEVIALNYNYIIHDGMAWSIKNLAPFNRAFLVVDEAHNLQRAAANLNSQKITLGTLRRALRELESFRTSRVEEIKELIAYMEAELSRLYGELKQAGKEDVEFDAAGFLSMLSERFDFDRCLSGMKRYGQRIRREQLKKGKRPRSSLHRLGVFMEGLLDSLTIEGVATIATRAKRNLEVEVWDMRSEEVLRDKWRNFKACVFCSGTLTPIKAFTETIGLRNYQGRSFSSGFASENIKTLVTLDLSTEGERLSRYMREKYLRAIELFVESNEANLAVFSASYRIQGSLLKGLREIAAKYDREVFVEKQGMSGEEGREILDGFKACSKDGRRGLLAATMQGRFAEGADFPGEELMGVFLVGVPFDRMNTRTRLYLDYYKRLYGPRKGNLYAYVIPALKRASQALGRCLRSSEDRAVFVLGDGRYAREGFIRVLPDYIRETAVKGSYEEVAELKIR